VLVVPIVLLALSPPAVRSAGVARVSILSANPVRVQLGFAGFNVALMDTALLHRDKNLASFASRLRPGWLRFPAGTRSDAFDWATGRSRPEWVERFAGNPFYAQISDALQVLEAKGGEHITDARTLARRVGAQGLIVCVNVFTDTPESAGRLAAFAKRNRIPVLVWEMGNEPTFFPRFFKDAADYATKVQRFAEAIRAVDPAARISLSLGLADRDREWDDDLAAYRPRYWDVLTYHHYPRVRGTEAEMMAALNQVLAEDTTEYIQRHIVPRFGAMPVIITEAAPGAPIAVGLTHRPGTTMVGTLYGGLWAAEYALRLSTVPQVLHVGMHQLVGAAGVDLLDSHHQNLLDAHSRGERLRRSRLDYGMFVSAQAAVYAVAAKAINSARFAYPTRVTGSGAAPLPDQGRNMPSLYAQAYRGRKWSLVVVNKGAQAETISVSVDGRPMQKSFKLTTVTGASPSARNQPSTTAVASVTGKAAATVRVPPYSAVLISW
jgi:hypothetical protein